MGRESLPKLKVAMRFLGTLPLKNLKSNIQAITLVLILEYFSHFLITQSNIKMYI